jgi:hypothetical protein
LDDLGDPGYRYDIFPSANMSFSFLLRLLGMVPYPSPSAISLDVRHPSLLNIARISDSIVSGLLFPALFRTDAPFSLNALCMGRTTLM